MTAKLPAVLSERLSSHIDLNKSRLETLVLLIVGMIGARTFNLSHITSERGQRLSLSTLLRKTRGAHSFKAALPGDKKHEPLTLGFAAKRLKGASCSSSPPAVTPTMYRKTRGIECLFGDAKTCGLNLEDTRITKARKLSLLLAIVAIAIAWSSITAASLVGRKAMPRKTHGYLAKSWFRTGFDALRKSLRHDHDQAVSPWLKIARPKRKRAGVV